MTEVYAKARLAVEPINKKITPMETKLNDIVLRKTNCEGEITKIVKRGKKQTAKDKKNVKLLEGKLQVLNAEEGLQLKEINALKTPTYIKNLRIVNTADKQFDEKIKGMTLNGKRIAKNYCYAQVDRAKEAEKTFIAKSNKCT